MPTYVVKKSGYLFGSYLKEGTELNLHPKQAKYPVLSGQIEPVGMQMSLKDVPKKAAPATPYTPPMPKTKRSIGGRVGGSFGDN